jgi:hypothetical protein
MTILIVLAAGLGGALLADAGEAAPNLNHREDAVPDANPVLNASTPALSLSDNGASPYRIVIAREASPSERYAAEELQRFLEQITGARLPIATDDTPLGDHEIILGDNAHLRAAGGETDLAALGDEGYIIRTVPPHLIIAGGRLRGTMYGVYGFLEDHLGCRWFTPTLSHIPSMPSLELGPIEDRQVPALEYREVFYQTALEGEWAARNRLNSSNATLSEEQGGKIAYYPFVHTFFTLIPPEKYFKSHPEWFSLVDGQRTLVGRYKRTQLCLTNEEMIRQAIATVKEWIRDHPEATIFSVSQNDGPGGWCECDNCAALEAREGGVHSAPIIYFVNRIAEAVAAEHPKVGIDTLAYSYSSQAPKNLKPLPNVIIRLTTGACGSHPIGDEKCTENAGLRDRIRDWFRLTRRIYIWDYIVNFRQYLLPFPNLGTLGANLQFFVDHGVRGVFEQGSGDVLHSDMAPLKAYLVAKLLWNPRRDPQPIVEEFLQAYYGPAAEPIGAYLACLQEEVAGEDYRRYHMSPFQPSIDAGYLTPERLAEATRLFDEAERRVADDPELLLRVQVARLSIDYVKLSLASRLSALLSPGESPAVHDWFRGAMDEFFATARRGGVTHMRESSRSRSSMEEFRQDLEAGVRVAEGSGAEIE